MVGGAAGRHAGTRIFQVRWPAADAARRHPHDRSPNGSPAGRGTRHRRRGLRRRRPRARRACHVPVPGSRPRGDELDRTAAVGLRPRSRPHREAAAVGRRCEHGRSAPLRRLHGSDHGDRRPDAGDLQRGRGEPVRAGPARCRERSGQPRDPHLPHDGGLPPPRRRRARERRAAAVPARPRRGRGTGRGLHGGAGPAALPQQQGQSPDDRRRRGGAAPLADQPGGRVDASRGRVVGPQGLLRRVLRRRVRGLRPPGGDGDRAAELRAAGRGADRRGVSRPRRELVRALPRRGDRRAAADRGDGAADLADRRVRRQPRGWDRPAAGCGGAVPGRRRARAGAGVHRLLRDRHRA